MNTNTDFAACIVRFLTQYLPHERNVSSNTIASYKTAFVLYIKYMKSECGVDVSKLKLEHLTRASILGFLKWLLMKQNNTPATCNYRLAALHSFVHYLKYEAIDRLDEWQRILSIKPSKAEVKGLNYLSQEGIKLLLSQPDVTTWKGRRHLAILSLMYDTGARVQEIADLTVGCVRLEHEPYSIKIFGKGRKTRIVPLAREQVVILRQYMEENGLLNTNNVSEPLFFNTRHEKLTREGVSYILKTYADLARIHSPSLIPQRISCQSIRHSRAMHLLQANVNLVYIRDILGHVSIQTTEIYARADSKAKRDALEKSYAKLTPDLNTPRKWEKNKDLLEWLMALKK